MAVRCEQPASEKSTQGCAATQLSSGPTHILHTLRPSSCINICTECPSLCQWQHPLRSTGTRGLLCYRTHTYRCLGERTAVKQTLVGQLPHPPLKDFTKQWPFKSSSLLPVPVLIFQSQIPCRICECLTVHFQCMDAFFCSLYQICFSPNKKSSFSVCQVFSGILHR